MARSNLGSLGLIRVGPRARKRRAKKGRKEGPGPQAAEGLLLHRQQQVSARATTVVSMPRVGYHGGRKRHRRIF